MKGANWLLVVFFLPILVFTSFYLLKFAESIYPLVYDEYLHIGAVEKIRASGPILGSIKESIMGMVFPLDFLVSFFGNYAFLMRIVPLMTGIANVLIIYAILRRVVSNERQVMLCSALFSLSPVFIYLHTTYNEVFFPLFLILAGALLIMKGYYFTGLVSLLLSLFFNLSMFIAIFVLLVIFYDAQNQKNRFRSLMVLVLSSFVFISINKASFVWNPNLHYLLTNYVTDIGALFGFGAFSLLLGLIGIIASWKEKKKYGIIYYSLAWLSICSLYDIRILVFAELIIVYFSGLAVMKIMERAWESTTLKNYVLLLVFCGVLFSSASFINRLSRNGPTENEAVSLGWLAEQREGRVFSHYEYGYMIEAISNKVPYTDKAYYLHSLDKQKIMQSDLVFQSRDLKNITSFFSENNISYIWINEKMKRGEVWKKDEEGLLFVLENSLAFKKIYDYKKIEIWKYIKRPFAT